MTQLEQVKAEIERLMNWKPKAVPSGMRQRDVLNIRKSVLLTLKDFINSLQVEKPSKDLEEEIESYLITNRQYAGGDEEDLWGDDCIRDAIKYGAQWQKEKMMKGFCFETKVYQDCDGDDIESPFQTWLSLEQNEITALPNLGLSDGDKVKVIIVKEDK